MDNIYNINDYKRNKNDGSEDDQNQNINIDEYDIEDDYRIYDDKFIEENLESLVYGTVPKCTVCGAELSRGDWVDNLWPIEFGYNICKSHLKELPEEFKEERLTNLEKMKQILVQRDYEKIIELLENDDIVKIEGNRIITEEKFQEIRAIIIKGKENI
jgi:hypothetical protein